MSEPCELLEKCGFFRNYRGNSENVKQGWIRLYCAAPAQSEQCERKRIRRATGTPPADNLSPTGQVLP